MFVTKHLQRYTRSGIGKRSTFIPPTLLPTGVYRASTSRYCWCALTAPLHPYPYLSKGGMFLWHYPHAHTHWELPSKFDLLGVRTFLKLGSQENPPCNHLTNSLYLIYYHYKLSNCDLFLIPSDQSTLFENVSIDCHRLFC